MKKLTKPRSSHHRFGACVAHLLIAAQLVLLIAGWQASRSQPGQGVIFADAAVYEGSAHTSSIQLARLEKR